MENPKLQVSGEVVFFMQCGLAIDAVKLDTNELTLKILKEIACNFVDNKYANHCINGMSERLMLFKHDYNSPNILLPIVDPSDITDGAIVEIIVSGNTALESSVSSVQISNHSLVVHSYKSPTFCDFCGEMLFGLVKQGLKCEGCRLNFHKRCAYKIPNNCDHRRRKGSTNYVYNCPTNGSVLYRTNSSGTTLTSELSYQSVSTSPGRDRGYSTSSSVQSGRPVWVDRELAGRTRVPHTFVIHSYKLPTVCQHCRKLLRGLFKQGLQCRECKFNVHKKCSKKIAHDCTGEAPKEYVESQDEENLEKDEYDIIESDLETYPDLVDGKQEVEQIEKKIPVMGTSSDNIPLMRIVQSVKHIKRKGSKALKEGWICHYTNKDSAFKKHFWRLDTKAITMFQNESSSKYYKDIPLTDISQINWNRLANHSNTVGHYCFELKTQSITYYVGEEVEIAKTWMTAIRQALMPVTTASGQDMNNGSAVQQTDQSGEPTHHHILSTVSDFHSHYQIFAEQVLGSGQFGTVYGGIHKSTSRSVAIKVIDKLRFPTKEESKLKNEALILQNIHNPGVVNLENMFETIERIFIVMERLEGDMLEMILSAKPHARLNERVAKFLIYQILIALKYLHSRNICHCDLKPENVLLSSNSDFPQVKLCDFGFAKIIGRKSFRRSVVGTPAYIAPEVIHKKRYNKSIDMWSVGIIIYVSLSGTFPFNKQEEVLDQITNADFMYPSDPWKLISMEAIHLVSNLLRVEIQKRYTVEKSLIHPWLQDYEVWCDLRELEAQVGIRWLTHESDDHCWEENSSAKQLPTTKMIEITDEKNDVVVYRNHRFDYSDETTESTSPTEDIRL